MKQKILTSGENCKISLSILKYTIISLINSPEAWEIGGYFNIYSKSSSCKMDVFSKVTLLNNLALF